MDKITYEIIEHYGTFDDTNERWKGQVNLVSWNDNPPKIDIRYWDIDNPEKSRRVGALSDEAAKNLRDILNKVIK